VEAPVLEGIKNKNPWPDPPPATGWKTWDGPATRQPKNRAEVQSMFGVPGITVPDPKWTRENIIECSHALGNALPGQVRGKRLWIHKTVEPYAREGLRRAAISCPDYIIDDMASWVFRNTRHDPTLPLSFHSWGIAIDVNTAKNGAKYFKKGEEPEAWSDAYNRIWPHGLPKAFVLAMESCGFTWGSDWDRDGKTADHTYQDPMHFEWTDRSASLGKAV
jgi:hypothetical protein